MPTLTTPPARSNLIVRLGTTVVAGAGAGRHLPYEITELDDLDLVHGPDIAVRAVRGPAGFRAPPDPFLAFIVG